jgi:lipopolysaccharide/colanic/teichoic acid biosynthesis glycosyltransferase
MNNSELSVETSSSGTFTESGAYIYPSSWDASSEELLQNDIVFHNGRSCNGVAEIECSGATAVHGAVDTQAAEVLPRLEGERLDLGLWLLGGTAIRHDQWKQLLGMSQGDAEVRGCDVEYSAGLIKRSFDVVVSFLLSVVLFPLFVLTAILIKLDSSGPVFFRHYRVGKGGRRFVLWKFRSMRMDVPKYEVSPQSAADARLTRVGRFIRRMSIDEIPQLINVLKGEMSLVGPRPEMPFIVDMYHSAEGERFAARPGITGLWQISPARAFPIHENLQYDLHYIRNQNLFLDCAIILRTITAVIHGIGAV